MARKKIRAKRRNPDTAPVVSAPLAGKATAAPKSKLPLVLAAVVVLVGGGVAAFFLLSRKPADPSLPNPPPGNLAMTPGPTASSAPPAGEPPAVSGCSTDAECPPGSRCGGGKCR